MTTTINNDVKQLVDRDRLTYERNLVSALIQKQQVFHHVKNHLCPKDPTTGICRPDFTTDRYNTLFVGVRTYWDMLDSREHPNPVPKGYLKTVIIDWANGGRLSPDVAQELLHELDIDFYDVDLQPAFLDALTGPALAYWLDTRLTRKAADEMSNRAKGFILTMDDLEMMVREAKAQRIDVANRAVNAGDLISGSLTIKPMLTTSLAGLNRVLGGGFGYGTASMFGGANASGKSVMAGQLGYDFSRKARNTVLVTTELTPEEVVARLACRHLNVPFHHFVQRAEVNQAFEATGVPADKQVPIIPGWIWSDQRYSQPLAEMQEFMRRHLFILDWSQGQGLNVTTHLETELDRIEAAGFNIDALIFDWIGGGLDNEQRARVDLRLVYQEAADWLVNYAKRRRKVVITLAQLDRTKAMGQARCGSKWLSECKTMVNNFTNFIGISSLTESGTSANSVFTANQFLYVEKARHGTGGCVPVERHFEFQRFDEKATGSIITPERR